MSDQLRVTIAPDEDVELVPGQRFAQVRGPLASILGRPELARAPLFVGTTLIDDDALCGHPPLVPGAVLAPSPRPAGIVELAAQAARAPWQLRVIDGPDAGWTLPLRRGSRIVVASTDCEPDAKSNARTGSLSTQTLAVEDADLGRGFVVRCSRRGPKVRRRLPTLREAASASALGRKRRSGRQLTTRHVNGGNGGDGDGGDGDGGDGGVRAVRPALRTRRLRPAGVLQAGLSTFDVTDGPAPALADGGLGSEGVQDAGAVASGRSSGPRSPGRARRAWATGLMFLIPAAGSLAMAVALRQPLFALMALMGPLMLLSRIRPDTERSANPASGHPATTAGSAPTHVVAALAMGVRPRSPHTGSRAVSLPLPASGSGRGRAYSTARALICSYAASGAKIVLVGRPHALAPWQDARWFPGAQLALPEHVGLEPSHSARPGGHGAVHRDRGRSQSETLALEDLPRGDVPAEDAQTLLVALSPRSHGWLDQLAAAWPRIARHTHLLLLDHENQPPPAWCPPLESRAGIGHRGFEDLARFLADDTRLARPSSANETHQSRRAPSAPDAGLPELVPLLTALDAPAEPEDSAGTADWIAQRWRAAPTGLHAVLGQAGGGRPVTVDLPHDGPHALIAGTTGAGKSEFLQTLICSLALTYSPEHLAIALVDYKGGASFGSCAQLPHVIGLVTDLEPGLAERALSGLRAELTRRERMLAEAGVTSLDQYLENGALPEMDQQPRDPLPRLLIVVDEFRAMADEHPDFIPDLLRIAAQGRSLGIHLVLATQRPGGAVNADMRANIGLRVCLRVTDPGESRDVLDSPSAAALPASAPGRAAMVTTAQPEQVFQSAYAPADPVAQRREVRRASPPLASRARSITHKQGVDVLSTLVDSARVAAEQMQLSPPRPAWLPALPDSVPLPEPDSATIRTQFPAGMAENRTLTILLLDLPSKQSRAWGGWQPDRGHLLIEGGAGSGRTGTLCALAHVALAQGMHVHVVGREEEFGAVLGHPGVGTVVGHDDPRRLAALLKNLSTARPPGAPAQVVLIDDCEEAIAALALLARGQGSEVLTAGLRLPRTCGVHFALASARPLPGMLGALISQRVVLASNIKHDDVGRGVPSALAGLGGAPGRAVWFGEPEPVLCQIAAASGPPPPPALSSGQERSGAVLRPLRIRPIPRSVHLRSDSDIRHHGVRAAKRNPAQPGARALTELHAVVGIGGDDATPLALNLTRGALITGPHGSGRSSALARVQPALDPERCLTIARDGPLLDLPARLRLTEFTGQRLLAALGTMREVTESVDADPALPWTVLLDDADALIQACPLEAEQLSRGNLPARLVAAATTSAAASALRGPLAELRSIRTGIVLDPATPGSADVFGTPLTWLIEPGPCPPGRGVLVHGRASELIQLAQLDAEPPARTPSELTQAGPELTPVP